MPSYLGRRRTHEAERSDNEPSKAAGEESQALQGDEESSPPRDHRNDASDDKDDGTDIDFDELEWPWYRDLGRNILKFALVYGTIVLRGAITYAGARRYWTDPLSKPEQLPVALLMFSSELLLIGCLLFDIYHLWIAGYPATFPDPWHFRQWAQWNTGPLYVTCLSHTDFLTDSRFNSNEFMLEVSRVSRNVYDAKLEQLEGHGWRLRPVELA